jgi:outer membrane receptor protein involved in Fe transport
MSGRACAAVLCVWVLALPAHSEAPEFPVSISDGPLFAGLKTLESQTGIELLYDGNVVRDFRSPPVAGTLTTEAALQQLLSETDLTVRRAASGAWIIERRAAPPLAQQDAAVAEILVVGRRTQNADIRRYEEDIQPYVVANKEEILRAHRDNIDQFIASRLTSSTTIVPSLASQEAGVMSSINLRGLGAADTVVLVDGRRMPSIPDVDNGFRQTDLNAIPLHAIERIEVLTGAAGGIHGFGALGGVVNIVLDRDVDEFEFHTSQGISSRGDSRRHVVEAKFGQTFGQGATDFVMFASHQELDTLRAADRGFAVRDYRRTHALAPEYTPLYYPHGNSLTVQGFLSPDLTFKPEFGGGALGSDRTYLPVGFAGDAAALTAALQQHSGQVDFSIADSDGQHDLGSNPRSSSLLANLRHRFGAGFEAYADVIMLRNRGATVGPFFADVSGGFRLPGMSNGFALMAPESPANPFTDYLSVSYPIRDLNGRAKKNLENSRYTTGIEADLPFDWRGTLEAAWGKFRFSTSTSDAWAPLGSVFVLLGDESDLDTNPLGDWQTFEGVVKSTVWRDTWAEVAETRFHTQSVRLAGPLFDTGSGRTMLTLLAERRSEHVPPSRETYTSEVGGETFVYEFRDDPLSRQSRSFYGELRSRLFDENTDLAITRGLELQLAVRQDEQEDDFQRTQILPDAGMLHSRFAGTAYTVGAKISPARWLTIRGSYSTGEQPPPLGYLVEIDPGLIGSGLDVDPRRGGTEPAPDGVLQLGGNSRLKAARAGALSLGAILTPAGLEGPTFALDYSRIRRARDVRSHTIDEILAHEAQWPARVRRAPLTDEDRANGYSGGVIEMIDVRDTNDGSLQVDAFDLRVEWPLIVLNGRLRLYADATYHKNNLRTTRYSPGLQWAGYLEGPLKRRANGGFDWSKGPLTVGANAQYFGSSLIYDRGSIPGLLDEDYLRVQGSARVPSQTYLDLFASWRLSARHPGPVDSFTLDLGVVNVLDRSPPRESAGVTFDGPGYSRYGDPRLRRFELGVSCQF